MLALVFARYLIYRIYDTLRRKDQYDVRIRYEVLSGAAASCSSFLCLLPQWIGLFFLTKTIVNGSARYFLQLVKVRMPNTVVRFTIVN